VKVKDDWNETGFQREKLTGHWDYCKDRLKVYLRLRSVNGTIKM
jgi:hypothetical protein